MAIPVWIPIALAAASTAANYQAQRKVDNSRQAMYMQNRRENEAEEKKAREAAARTRDEYAGQRQKQEDAGADWADQLKAGQQPMLENVAPSRLAGTVAPTTDRVVADTANRARGTRRYTNRLADALGAMRGFDDAMLGASLSARDNAMDIRRAAGNMAGNNRVLEARLNNANTKGRTWGTAGDLLSLASMLTTPAALTAQPAAAGAAGTGGSTAAAAGPGVMRPGAQFKMPGLITY